MNQEQPKKSNTRPVVTYILILFTAAFFIMAFSLVANQRSNDQTLDELRDSISSLEKGQTAQEYVVSLQKKQSELEQSLLTLESDVENLEDTLAMQTENYKALEKQYDALSKLYTLELQLQTKDYATCLTTIQTMEDSDLVSSLSTTGHPSPAQRFEEIKLLVLNA